MPGRAITESALLSGETTVITCPGPGPWRVAAIYVTGHAANDDTVDIDIVKSGGSTSTSTVLIEDLIVPADELVDLEIGSAPIYLQHNGTVRMTPGVSETNEMVGWVSLVEKDGEFG